MMPNPFEDADTGFLVLVNEEGQHSLWPSFVAVPPGWEAVFGEDRRERCLEYVEEAWSDIRPHSLIAAMKQR
ncbi:MbtH protein [Streptomyces sp. V4I2]|nr:MbtH protein [Streptomyces sp. V4I2]